MATGRPGFNFNKPAAKPAAAKPPATGAKPPGGPAKPAAGIAKGPGNPQRAISPPSASNGRAPLEHKNSQVGLRADPKSKAGYGTIIRGWNSSSNTSKANLLMLEKKNLLPLILLHRNNNIKVQGVASEVIDSLVELPDGFIGMDPTKVNGFRPLVDLYKREDVDAEIPVLAVQSLAHLAANPSCRTPIMTEVGWFNIPKMARSSDVDMKIACALLLGNLSHEPKNQKIIIEKGVPLLLENLKDASTPEEKSALLSAFADISLIKEYGAPQIWDSSLLQYVIPAILHDSSQDVKIAAVSLLCNVCDTSTPTVHTQIINSGIVEKLDELLKNDVNELQANVALVIARVGKSPAGRKKFESLPSFRNLIDKLTSKSPTTQFQVAGALDVLADSESIKQTLKKEDCVEFLEEIILSTSHAQVEELALQVLKKLDGERGIVVAEKLSARKEQAAASASTEETLQFSPRAVSPRLVSPRPEVPKPATDAPPRSRPGSVKMQPLQAFANAGTVDLQRDHQFEVQRLQEEKRRLEELLKKERDAERENSSRLAAAASPGSNIDDKIKGSLKSIQENVNLEVDLLGDERKKIEEWKRAIENFKNERIIYEKDLEILRKDQDHLAKERESFAADAKNVASEREKIERERSNILAENEKLGKEHIRLKQDLDNVAKSREKLEREKAEFEKEREADRNAAKGASDQSSVERERADREREKAERAEKERQKAEDDLEKAEKERRNLEDLLASERRKFEEELERERRKAEEERVRAASAENSARSSNKDDDEKTQIYVKLQQDYEEITLKFEKEKKRFEKEKEKLQAELEILREGNNDGDSSGKVLELQKTISELEETVDETKRANKLLEQRVAELEEELRRRDGDRDKSEDDQRAFVEEEKRRLEELARKLEADQEALDRKAQEMADRNGVPRDDEDENDPDLAERQRRQLEADLKKLEEWELAKQNEKEESKKRLDEEIELLRQRHASWERKQAIAMADLIAKEQAIFEREEKLNKFDDELYEREVKVADAEARPARRAAYSSDESMSRFSDDQYSSDDDDYYRGKKNRYTPPLEDSPYSSENDHTASFDSSSDEHEEPPPPVIKKERKPREPREEPREKKRPERKSPKPVSSPKPATPKPVTPSPRPKSGLKSSSGIKSSGGISKPATPKPRPPIDYLDPMDDMDDDDDDLFSVEGLAASDPYEAARKLLALLELDPSRATESNLEALRKFAKNRSGAPTQYEARDIIPALVYILRLCTDPAHEEIINICLLILAILAFNKDSNQLYIRRVRGNQEFEIFLNFGVESVRARAALAIAAYSLNNIPIKNEIGPAVTPKLVAMLNEAHPGIRKSASTALAALVDNNKYNKKSVKKLDGVKTILELLKKNHLPPKYSLHLLASLAHDSKSIKKEVPKYYPDVFRKIILLLTPFTKPSVLSAAVASLMELARNTPNNQKAIWKAGATHYLLIILINKDKYNNDELIANTLFLCWVIARIAPKGLADKEFDDPKWTMADILKTLKDTNSEVIKKLIQNLEAMIRTMDVAGKNAGRASPLAASPSPYLAPSSAASRAGPSPSPSASGAASPAIRASGSVSPGPSASGSASPAIRASVTIAVPPVSSSLSGSASISASPGPGH